MRKIEDIEGTAFMMQSWIRAWFHQILGWKFFIKVHFKNSFFGIISKPFKIEHWNFHQSHIFYDFMCCMIFVENVPPSWPKITPTHPNHPDVLTLVILVQIQWNLECKLKNEFLAMTLKINCLSNFSLFLTTPYLPP